MPTRTRYGGTPDASEVVEASIVPPTLTAHDAVDAFEGKSAYERLEKLLREGYSKGEIPSDWLSRILFHDASAYENLSVGNPQVRDAWIAAKAEALSKISDEPKLIDVSAGNKPYEEVFSASGFKYFSSEFVGNALLHDDFRGESQEVTKSKEYLKMKHDYIYSDIKNTGIPADTFDVAVLSEVLEHLPEPITALHELARIVRAGGHILVTAPFTSGSHQLPFHFSSGYPREWYAYAANQTGLEVVDMTSQGDFFKLMAQEINRATTCGSNPSELEPGFAPLLDSMRQAFYHLLLLKGVQNDANVVGCMDQFTIGWMVHLRKPDDST